MFLIYYKKMAKTKFEKIKKQVYANTNKRSVKKATRPVEKLQGATLTFSHSVENHIGNQQIGKMSDSDAVSVKELKKAVERIKESYPEADVEVKNLNEFLPEDLQSSVKAGVLLFRGGVDVILNKYNKTAKNVLEEQNTLQKDKKFFSTRMQRVLNKHARHNLCFDDYDQQPEYEKGKGTVVNFKRLPVTSMIRTELGELFGEKATNLKAEGNYYYDLNKTGIGFHGDTERRDVYGVRLGAGFPLHYQWFQYQKPIGERCVLELGEGDIYVMSEKAVGFDWLKSKDGLLTLRHAAGSAKYTTIKNNKN